MWNPRNALWLLLSLAVYLLDQWSKGVVVGHFTYREVLPVGVLGNAGFNLTLAHNYGAAFSFLADQPGWQRWFFTLVALAVSSGLTIWLLRLAAGQRLLAVGLGLLIGGALGNLHDRILLGYVVDFLDFFYGRYHWPAFNVADSAICVGAGLLLLDSWREPRAAKPEQGR